jgi:hypothetical protein
MRLIGWLMNHRVVIACNKYEVSHREVSRGRRAGTDHPQTMQDGLVASDQRAEPAEQSAEGLGDQVRRGWRAYRRLTKLGFPRHFQIVQFPNFPLMTALIAGCARHFVAGAGRPYLTSVGYLAMTVWAYEELAHGSNWFRHVLGFAFVIIIAIRVAHAVS